MAVFKCKMCGGNLEISDGMTVCECEYCGTTQTLPKLDDEKKANLYDRAGHFRRNNDFDKAIGVYEKILEEDKTDSEAYWSLVLCKYGIEYVEDPSSHKRVPTVNRAQFTSIYADEDYKSALEYADTLQKIVYEAEAHAIDEIQKGILEISEKEEPFDVFICYKETDANGRRTPDSVLANDLYHQLTQEGFKVFFSRITLEDKLGTAYEPYIFAALKSAKVMVVLGTKPEYFGAVWVKNEWSRYLALIKNGAKKVLIPAYKDMDPYDLPEEFSHLQAQDMSKLGFMQDLIRGIKKLTAEEKPRETVVKETVVTAGNSTNTAPLLKRAFMFLEDGKWDSAGEYCEKVLDIDPECARAYLGKFMAEMQVRKEEDIPKVCKDEVADDGDLFGFDNYSKAKRFGDDKLIETLEEYNNRTIYLYAEKLEEEAENDEEFKGAKEVFERIPDYSDAKERAAECEEKAKEFIYNSAKELEGTSHNDADFRKAKAVYERVPNYSDAKERAEKCEEKAKDYIYGCAERKAKEYNIASLGEAISLYQSIRSYNDSEQKITECQNRIAEIEAEQKAAKEKAEREAREAEQKAKARDLRIEAVVICVSLFIGIMAILIPTVIFPAIKYNEAIELYNNGQFDEAAAIFGGIHYSDSSEMANKSKYQQAMILFDAGEYSEAIGLFEQIGDYNDSKEKITECKEKLIEYIGLLNNKFKNFISAGDGNTVGLKSDGTVVAVGNNVYGRCDVSDWNDIVAVSAGRYRTVGLKSDGTVVAVGENYWGQCDVSDWNDIVAVSAGDSHTVGLKSDGTVIAVGGNKYGQCDISDWKDIVAVSAGDSHTVGLKSDGTVVAVGRNEDGQCNVSGWKDIIAVSAGKDHTVGLKSDGTVVAVGYNDDGQCDVSGWKDIIAVSAGEYHTVGLKSDGTVVAVGYNRYGQCDVSGWKDIVAVSAGSSHTVGLKSDGTVVAVGGNGYGQCDVSDCRLMP